MFGWGPTRTSVALSLTIVFASLGLAPVTAASTELVPEPIAGRSAGDAVDAASEMTDATPVEVVHLAAQAGGVQPVPATSLNESIQLGPVPDALRPGLELLLTGILEASATLPAEAQAGSSTVPEASGAAVRVLEAIAQARPLLTSAAEGAEPLPNASLAECASGDVIVEIPRPIEDGCVLVVGGPGPTVYEEDAIVSVDLGGGDQYENNAGGSRIVEPVTLKRGGVYIPPALGFAWDLGASNDTYAADGDSLGPVQGASNGYLGVLVDDGGSDVYRVTDDASHTITGLQGASHTGLGLLADLGEGADRYTAFSAAQGHTQLGLGLLLDGGGSDQYVAEAGLAQGTSREGLAFVAGGLGALVDQGNGDDAYTSNGPVAQGAVDLGGVGLLADGGGNDTYHAERWAQGASDAGQAGVLFDADGRDTYAGAGECQGYGESGGVGVLVEGGGADTYECPSPSIPDRGDDRTWHFFTGGFTPGMGVGLDAERP